MPKIIKITRMENLGDHALIYVLTDKQDEAVVWVGGAVEIYHNDKFDRTNAFVKRPPIKLKESLNE